jgi:hypothetical protein
MSRFQYLCLQFASHFFLIEYESNCQIGLGFKFDSMLFELYFKILIQLYLNPIQLNINSIQLKLYAMTTNIFIQMEFNFHKQYSFLNQLIN